MSPTTTIASDPSVADYRATSPSEWGGLIYESSPPDDDLFRGVPNGTMRGEEKGPR
jgi:hypothetical protein